MKAAARVLSVNVGRIQTLDLGERSTQSAIRKAPVAGPVWLGVLGLEGDQQADRRFHGGPDKAVNVYPSEHYEHWRERLEGPLAAGAFGENFTTQGFVETEICIGDTYRIGDAIVQVTQPRTPCSKLAGRHSEPQLIGWVNESRFTGFYFRCLEEGQVEAGDEFELLSRPDALVSVADAHRIQILKQDDVDGARRLLAVAELSVAWREAIEKRLGRG